MKQLKDLESAIKEKVSPLLEETMEKSLGITIPKLESDISDKLKKPQLQIYVPFHLPFQEAKRFFKAEFIKKELQFHLGNISHLAKTVGLDRRSIHRAIKDLEINVEEVHHEEESKEKYQQNLIDQTIRKSLDEYKEIIQPQKMEKMYEQVPELSRNIAKFLPYQELTWKEAEGEFEKQFLEHSLQENQGNVAQTAKQINIRAETLHRKIKKLGIKL